MTPEKIAAGRRMELYDKYGFSNEMTLHSLHDFDNFRQIDGSITLRKLSNTVDSFRNHNINIQTFIIC